MPTESIATKKRVAGAPTAALTLGGVVSSTGVVKSCMPVMVVGRPAAVSFDVN